MDTLDRAIVNGLQDGFPLCERPFGEVAAGLGCDEATLIERIRALLEDKTLTRFGPLYDAERMGGAFTLCAMSVPAGEFERVAAQVNARREVAHNYERAHRFNMWFVLAVARPEEIERVLREIERETGYAVLEFPRLAEYFIELKLEAA